ncbi:hypothetical protein [Kitasatospora sp. NPDC057223]|uniref:hypothetical protein n=1 Tax=Kitasatospora sp. NPDC057223 TaxID=3346055 RepID=UPI00363D5BD3
MAAVLEKFHSLPAALAPALPDDAPHPIRFQRIREGVVAAYSPAQLARADAWQILTDLFGTLIDVTPASVVTA